MFSDAQVQQFDFPSGSIESFSGGGGMLRVWKTNILKILIKGGGV